MGGGCQGMGDWGRCKIWCKILLCIAKDYIFKKYLLAGLLFPLVFCIMLERRGQITGDGGRGWGVLYQHVWFYVNLNSALIRGGT